MLLSKSTKNGSLLTCCRTIYYQYIFKKHDTWRLIHDSSEECNSKLHVPVMSKEVLNHLSPEENQVIIDMTFGAGGHSEQILNAAENVKLFALDRDPDAFEHAVNVSNSYRNQLIPLLGRFSELPKLLAKHNVKQDSIDGILLDVGCSSMQFDSPERGFSVSRNGPLDMRMDKDRFSNQPTAADVLNTLDYPGLVKIFKVYGEEKYAKPIAQAIIDSRFMMKRIYTTQELAEIVSNVVSERRVDKLQRKAHCATKVFQGLRIFVNNELNELNYALELAYRYLRPGGRIVAVTFHSLEDRIVKRHIMGIDMDEPISSSIGQKYKNAAVWHSKQQIDVLLWKRWLPINKKVILPSDEEIQANPRSRSAKLRAATKI